MVEIVNLARRRWAEATSCEEITVLDTLREAVSRIEAGEWSPDSAIVIASVPAEPGDFIELMHGGPASTNERLGMLVRSQHIMTAGE